MWSVVHIFLFVSYQFCRGVPNLEVLKEKLEYIILSFRYIFNMFFKHFAQNISKKKLGQGHFEVLLVHLLWNHKFQGKCSFLSFKHK